MIKLRLYNTGIDGSGKKITPFYTEQTVFNKKNKKQISSHVTLRDTGSFYKSIYLKYDKGVLTINSLDYKTPFLIEKYGENILSLTEQEQNFIIDYIIEPEINLYIIKNLNSIINIKLNL